MNIRLDDRVKRRLSIFGFACLAWAAGPDLDRANKLYNITEFQQSLEVLHALGNKDAAVYDLMGRDYYGLGEFRKATEALEKARADENSQELFKTRSPLKAAPRASPPADRSVYRSRPPLHQAGPLSGSRPQPREGGTNRPPQCKADVCESRSIHQRQSKS